MTAICIGGPFTVFGQGQWIESQLPIPSDVIIYDIDFESENRGWAVGTDGHILFFDGNYWDVDTVIAGYDFSKVVFPKENEGWATTISGRIFKHDGDQWNLEFTATGAKGLYTLYFINPDEGFVSGADGYLAYYNGTEWIEGNIGSDAWTLTSYFSDNKNGWLSSGAEELYQFQDSVWSFVALPGAGAFNAMAFTAPDNGYGTGFSKDIWHYNGSEWTVDYTGENDQFTSLFFLDDQRGWAGGMGYIASYQNGSWTEEVVNSSWIFDIYFTDPNHGWALGEDAVLLTYTNPYASLNWRSLDFFTPELSIADFSTNPSGVIYAAGYYAGIADQGSGLFKSADGASWTKINSEFNDFLIVYSIHALDNNTLLASVIDSDGSLLMLRSMDEGITWSPAQNGIETNAIVQYMTSDNNGDIYAAANRSDGNTYTPQLYKSTDMGETWGLVNINGFPVSGNAAFLNVNHTGSEFLISYQNIETSENDIYISADGMAWSKLDNVPSGFYAIDIVISNNDTWFVSGVDIASSIGRLYSSTNKGATWEPMGTMGIEDDSQFLGAIHSVDGQLLLSASRKEVTDIFSVYTTIAKQEQTITFNPLAPASYGQANFSLTASASSGLPLTYSSSNTSVASVADDVVMIAGAGTTTITGSQEGNDSFFAAENTQQTLTVEKALLEVSVQNTEREVGEPNPTFVLAYEGFVNGETIEVIDVLPETSTMANAGSEPGQYEIAISGGSDNNYAFSYQFGTLTVVTSSVTGLDHPAESGIKIYPNPTVGIINVEVTQWPQKGIVEVFNAAGTKIMTDTLHQNITFNLESYPSGMYLVRVWWNEEIYVFNVLKK